MAALRAFAVMLGGPIVLLAVVLGCAAWLAASLIRGEAPSPVALVVVAITAAYAILGRRWMRTWGASREEAARPVAGEPPGNDARAASTRAVTIAAPADEVWPWLAQIGQDRGGFYSYEWLENLAGCRMRNADRVVPEWQRRRVGEMVPLHPQAALELTNFDPPRSLALDLWGAWAVEPAGEGSSRLLARGEAPRGAGRVAYAALLELPHFLMERRMLLGIKRRAEAARGG